MGYIALQPPGHGGPIKNHDPLMAAQTIKATYHLVCGEDFSIVLTVLKLLIH